MATQKIRFLTNYNNKLSCPHFIHIDQPPSRPITETRANETIIEISTIDNSHPPVQKKLVDLARAKVKDINHIFFYISHGMTIDEYITYKKVNGETELAIYYYSPADTTT